MQHFVLLVVLGIKAKSLGMLGKHGTAQLHPYILSSPTLKNSLITSSNFLIGYLLSVDIMFHFDILYFKTFIFSFFHIHL